MKNTTKLTLPLIVVMSATSFIGLPAANAADTEPSASPQFQTMETVSLELDVESTTPSFDAEELNIERAADISAIIEGDEKSTSELVGDLLNAPQAIIDQYNEKLAKEKAEKEAKEKAAAEKAAKEKAEKEAKEKAAAEKAAKEKAEKEAKEKAAAEKAAQEQAQREAEAAAQEAAEEQAAREAEAAAQAELEMESLAPMTRDNVGAASSSSASPAAAVAFAQSESKGETGIVGTAYTGVGAPYVWGGSSPSGWDCSGFVHWVYAQNGISVARGTSALLSSGQFVRTSSPQPGDLVFQNGNKHVGIYVGNGQMIGAQNPSVDTILHSVNRNPVSGYYTLKK